MYRKLLTTTPLAADWGILFLRVVFCGLLIYNHAYMKLTLFSESPDSFPDPLGFGPSATYYLVVFSEFVCSGLVMLGLFTRPALTPLLVTMAVAVFSVHWSNAWTDKEPPLLYLAAFTALFLLGPGRFSLDALLWGKRRR